MESYTGKKDGYLFTIGEAAKAMGITRRIILNYEEKGLITPDVKSEVDGRNGHRYYTMDTLSRMGAIRLLQNLGLSLDEIIKYYYNESDLNVILGRLEELQAELNYQIERIRARTESQSNNQILTLTFKAQKVYCETCRSHSLPTRFEDLRRVLYEGLHQHQPNPFEPNYFVEYPLDDLDQITYCVPVARDSVGDKIHTLPALKGLGVYHHGPYEGFAEQRERLVRYAQEADIPLAGTCRHLYLEGPALHLDSTRYVTLIFLPLAE